MFFIPIAVKTLVENVQVLIPLDQGCFLFITQAEMWEILKS